MKQMTWWDTEPPGSMKSAARNMRKYRWSMAYKCSDESYYVTQAVMTAWRKGGELPLSVRTKLVVDSLREFIEIMEKKAAFPLRLETYGIAWEWDHIRPISSFDFRKPQDREACHYHSNLMPVKKWTNLNKGRKYVDDRLNPNLPFAQ